MATAAARGAVPGRSAFVGVMFRGQGSKAGWLALKPTTRATCPDAATLPPSLPPSHRRAGAHRGHVPGLELKGECHAVGQLADLQGSAGGRRGGKQSRAFCGTAEPAMRADTSLGGPARGPSKRDGDVGVACRDVPPALPTGWPELARSQAPPAARSARHTGQCWAWGRRELTSRRPLAPACPCVRPLASWLLCPPAAYHGRILLTRCA